MTKSSIPIIGKMEYKWIVGMIFVFGMFMELLDTTVVNVALPTFSRVFVASTTQVEWVVTGYLLSLAVFIPISGWAGDRFGTKRIFVIALILFTGGSLLCGLAWNIESLAAFRVLQGVGGGMMTPVGQAMLFRAFPPQERVRASTILVVPTVVGPAMGPLVGGALVEYLSWRWIFFVNIPIGILGILAAVTLLREEKQANPGKLDIPGVILGGAGLATVVYALSQAGSKGFTDPRVVTTGVVGFALLAAFVAWELRTKIPMLDIRLFKNHLFRITNIVMFLLIASMMGGLFLLPIFLQSELGLGAFESGLTTFPQAIGIVLMSQISGKFYRRVGPRRLLILGGGSMAIVTLLFVFVGVGTNLWWIRGIMLLRGMAFGTIMLPLQTAAFATIKPQEQGRASAISASFRQVGASLGVAVVATVFTNRLVAYDAQMGNPATVDDTVRAFHIAFIVAAALVAGAALMALRIRDTEALQVYNTPPTGAAQKPMPETVKR